MENKKKLFFLINSLEWWWAERVIINLSEELSKENDVTIITLKNINFYDLGNWVKHIALSNIKNNLLMFMSIPYYIWKFKQILKQEKFNTWVSSLEISNFINILTNKNAIISFETNIRFFKGIIWNIYKILIRILYPKAIKIKVNSKENKYDLAKYLNINENKIIAIYNPLNLEKIENFKKEEIDEKLKIKIQWKKVFVTVWRLIKSKYHEKLINSFKLIYYNWDKNWIYLVVGDWLEKQKLEKQVNNFWLQNNIIFLWSQKNVFKYLNVSNYFVYASEIEWFPNVLWEAIVCWLPIITSDFKTWAKECIVWNYEKNSWNNIKYPYYGANWVLLDLQNYENQFLEVYSNLNKITQNKVWFEKFNLENVALNWKILFNL